MPQVPQDKCPGLAHANFSHLVTAETRRMQLCLRWLTLEGPAHHVYSVAFHPINPSLVTGMDKTAKIWNVGGAQFKALQQKLESEFGAAHPIAVKMLAGDTYKLEDWGLCKDLEAAVCELAPATLGKPSTFGLLANLGGRSEELGGGGAVQNDGKYGSNDRRRMLVPGCGF